jgi:hypothetical protein
MGVSVAQKCIQSRLVERKRTMAEKLDQSDHGDPSSVMESSR